MKPTSTRRDLLTFLKKPHFEAAQDLAIKSKIVIVLKVLILTYIGLVIANVPFTLMKKLNLIGEVSSAVNLVLDAMTQQSISFKPYFIFTSALLVPLLEETAFRLFLTRFKINYFIVSVSLITGILILHFTGALLWRPESYLLLSLSTYFYVLIISGVIGTALWLGRKQLEKTEKSWNNNPGLIFYSSAVFFAFFHFMSINLNGTNLLLTPIILLPFMVYGLAFGYIRIRLGFIYSILLHFIILGIRLGLPELLKTLKTVTL